MPYIGRSTDGFGVRNRFIYLATSGATSVSGADANGATLTFTDGAYVDVYLNGVLLKPTTDYNTSTAGTIAGLSALNTNDEVTVVVYDVFTVGDMVSATSGGTFVGNVNFSGNIDVDGTANLDAVDIDGAVDMASTLAVGGAVTVTTGSSGASANSVVDDLVVQGSGRSGISILTPDANDGQLVFGSPSDSIGAFISYKHSTARMDVGTSLSGASLHLASGDGSTAMTLDGNGHVTMPKQPAFHVTGSTQNNVTHNADFYPLKGSGSVIYDVNSDVSLSDNVGFSPGNVHFFVAPVTGKYMFECRLRFDNMTADISYISTSIVTSNRAHGVNMHSTNYFDATASYHSHQGTVIADLDAGDSAYIVFYIAGGTTGTDLDSHSFKGILIA